MSLTNVRILILIIFMIFYTIVYIFTSDAKEALVEHSLSHEIENLENSYRTSMDKFNLISNTFYSSVLNKDEILKLLYKAKHSKDDLSRSAVRKILYKKMKPHFDNLDKAGVNIMLFSFENNKVFLRVHKPEKFDDDVSSVRYAVTYTNESKKLIQGLEQGKISHAFRNVFPLFYKEEYLGSVDISFSSEAVQDNMILLHDTHTHFLVNKNLFNTNIWQRQKKVKYIQSIENENFLFALTRSHSMDDFTPIEIDVNKKLKKDIDEKLKTNNSFALYDGSTIVSYFALKNIKEKKTVAYLVSYVDSFILKNIIQKHFIVNIIIITALMIIYFVIINNIKQRFCLEERIEEELQKNEKQQQTMFNQSRLAQMGEMISMIAHQWRQPLAAISVASINLRMQLEFENFNLEEEEGREKYINYLNNSLTNIDQCVKSLTTTVDDFRNFYKINKELVSTTLEDVCNKAINLIDSSLKNDDIELIYNYDSKQKIELFENEMMHVVLNILKNAQDNFKEKNILKPKIKIITRGKTITICDNGGGISNDIIENIFDPYFSTKDAKQGTGLGLYMSKVIIEEHHAGVLSVINKDDGVCFTIKL